VISITLGPVWLRAFRVRRQLGPSPSIPATTCLMSTRSAVGAAFWFSLAWRCSSSSYSTPRPNFKVTPDSIGLAPERQVFDLYAWIPRACFPIRFSAFQSQSCWLFLAFSFASLPPAFLLRAVHPGTRLRPHRAHWLSYRASPVVGNQRQVLNRAQSAKACFVIGCHLRQAAQAPLSLEFRRPASRVFANDTRLRVKP